MNFDPWKRRIEIHVGSVMKLFQRYYSSKHIFDKNASIPKVKRAHWLQKHDLHGQISKRSLFGVPALLADGESVRICLVALLSRTPFNLVTSPA